MTDESELNTAIKIVLIIPTYNNEHTISTVLSEAKKYVQDIIVVNDGSTDSTPSVLHEIDGIHLIEFTENRGKGAALQAGFASASEKGYTHAITFDADGQHLAKDIPLFLEKIALEPQTLWIGDRVIEVKEGVEQPTRSRFGRKFGAFWYRFYTGIYIRDTQSGFRAYPLNATISLECYSTRYEYEIELLIAAAWNDIHVKSIPIHLLYHPPQERVSHFRPVRDFVRISKINSKAAIARLFLPSHIRKVKGLKMRHKIKSLVLHELKAHTAPVRAAASLAAGVFLGLTPFHGFQVLLMIAATFLVKLNRPLAFLGISVSSPPLVPFWILAGFGTGKLCIPQNVAAAFVKVAKKCLHPEFASAVEEFFERLIPSNFGLSVHGFAEGFVQWFFGSIILAVVCGIVTFAIAFPIFRRIKRSPIEP